MNEVKNQNNSKYYTEGKKDAQCLINNYRPKAFCIIFKYSFILNKKYLNLDFETTPVTKDYVLIA